MADYFTQFCTWLTLDTPEKKAFFEAETEKARVYVEEADGDQTPCEFIDEADEGYLTDRDACGGVDWAADVIQRYLKKFRIKKPVTLTWANTCSKPRPDSFSGGSLTITAKSIVSADEEAMKYRKMKKFLDVLGEPKSYTRGGLHKHFAILRGML